jgi:steroid delta-isomerase-like uncharacterized protein
MPTEDNKLLIMRFFDELWNGRRLDVADEIFAENCLTHQLRSGREIVAVKRGPAEIREHVSAWLEGFPDIEFIVEQIIAEGDVVVTRVRMSGTHAGPWLGIAATGNRVNIRMMTTHKISGGKIVEDWVLIEALGFLHELGLLPPVETIVANAAA